MSNPYGGPYDPYEQPDPSRASESPYGSPNPYASPLRPKPPVDGVSIAGFVVSLLCCTGLIGLILGIVGISRTKDGRRSGRWAAVSAIVLGTLGLLATAGVVVFFVWFGTSMVYPASADVGQCVDVDEQSGGDTVLWDRDCTEPHDAELVVVDEFDDESLAALDTSGAAEFCARATSDQQAADLLRSGDYEVGIVVDGDPDDPGSGDAFVCWVGARGGDQLEEPLLGESTSDAAASLASMR